MDNHKKEENIIVRLLKPAVIVTLLTSVIYLIGYVHINSYFETLCIDHRVVNLPMTFYLVESLPVILLLLFVIGLASHEVDKPTKNLLIILRWNSPILLIIFTTFYGAYVAGPSLGSRLLIMMGVIGAFFLVIALILRLSFPKEMMIVAGRYKPPMQIAGFSMLLIFILLLASVAGMKKAKNLTRSTQTVYIKFLTTSELNDISGKEYFYVIHIDDKYYVVEKESLLSNESKLLVIPDREILKVEIYRKSLIKETATEDTLHKNSDK